MRGVAAIAWAFPALWLAVSGCGRQVPDSGPPSRAEGVYADTGRSQRLRVVAPDTSVAEPAAEVWLAQVTPKRPERVEAPLPEAELSALDELPLAPPPLEVDPGLKPPILKAAAVLRTPPHARRGSVELDVRVAEDGSVSDAVWAGGASDSALTAAAIECALQMRFYPALQAGRAVAVWCRQRFDFSSR